MLIWYSTVTSIRIFVVWEAAYLHVMVFALDIWITIGLKNPDFPWLPYILVSELCFALLLCSGCWSSFYLIFLLKCKECNFLYGTLRSNFLWERAHARFKCSLVTYLVQYFFVRDHKEHCKYNWNALNLVLVVAWKA